MIERILKLLVLISTAGVLFVNYLASTGAIGGITPAYLSEKFPTIITPSGYAFSIWGLIYLGVIVFSVYQLFVSGSQELMRIRPMYIVTSMANIGWIFAWHYQYLGLSVIAMLVLLGSLLVIIFKHSSGTGFQPNLIRTVFGMYFGWVSVASVLNINIFFIAGGIGVFGTGATIGACLGLVLLASAGAFIREKLTLPLYPLSLAWAFTAIGVEQSGRTAIVLTCALAMMAMIFSSLTFVLKDQKTAK